MDNVPVLPHFIRWSWVSMAAREEWLPRFVAASNAMDTIERYAVLDGILPHIVQKVPVSQLESNVLSGIAMGLTVLPVAKSNEEYECLITRPETLGTHLSVLRSTGPKCCQVAQNVRVASVDASYEQMAATTGRPGLSNMLWRPMGIRLLPFQPCSFSCPDAEKIASDITGLGKFIGFHKEIDTIQTVLDMPLMASRLYGIHEAVSFIVKFVTRSNWTPTKDSFFVPSNKLP